MPAHTTWHFRPNVLPTLAALAVVALTCALGVWQVHRAAYKLGLQHAYEEAAQRPAVRLRGDEADLPALNYRRIAAAGEFEAARAIFLDNRFSNERVGFRVVVPLRLEGSGRYLLVDRGWLPRDRGYPAPPPLATPAGRVEIAGIASVPSGRFVELSKRTESGSVWQNLTIERYRERIGLDVLPIVLVQLDGPANGLVQAWDRPELGIDRHRGYAFQWFALAATIFVVWIVTNLKRTHAERSPDSRT